MLVLPRPEARRRPARGQKRAAGVAERLWEVADIVALMEAEEAEARAK